MAKGNKFLFLGILLMFGTTLAWGSAFAILKTTIGVLPPTYVIAIRFFTAGVIACAVTFKQIRKISKKTLVHGIVIGFICAMGYFVQTQGLAYTTPSRNAFVTSIYGVMCPFLLWAIKKVKPKGYNVISAVLCIVGIGFIACSEGLDFSDTAHLFGDFLTFISAIFYALQVIFIDKYEEEDGMVILPLELIFAGIILVIMWATTELPFHGIEEFAIGGDSLFNVIYLTLVCTLLAQAGQFYGMKFANSPNLSALILSTESVFGAVFAVLLGQETLSPLLIIGFVIVFVSLVLTILKIDLLKPFRKKTMLEKPE